MAEMNNSNEMRERLGNIDQIRDLLVGEQLKDNDKRFQTLEANLVSLKEYIEQVRESLVEELKENSNSLEKKIKYLGLTTHEEINKIVQDNERQDKNTSRELERLEQNFTTKAEVIREEIAQNKEKFQEDLLSLKNVFLKELEANFANLKDIKVSRDDLAEVLFELCIKIKGADFVPDLKEAVDGNTKTDFILPE